MLLNPTSPLGFALLLLRGRLDRARRPDEFGASAIEWVVITAMLVAIAGAVFAILYVKIRNTANAVNTSVTAP
jgi:hypothetical protein